MDNNENPKKTFADDSAAVCPEEMLPASDNCPCSEDLYDQKLALAARKTVEDSQGMWTRVEEVVDFARRINAKKIGIATCVGLLTESRTLAQILRARGFDVFGICCKVGAMPKAGLGFTKEQLAGFRSGKNMCNPILQAELLNEEETDLNIIMGLCVGHDSLFIKNSRGICTSLVIKDRVLGNNPAAALYTTTSYYKKLLQPQQTPSAIKFLAEQNARKEVKTNE